MSCTICFERFKGSDDLYSTSCGHVYHHQCMQQWKNRSSSCPQCRVKNPMTHKIFLELDDFEANNKRQLEAELKTCHLKIEKLEQKLRKRPPVQRSPNSLLNELEDTLDYMLARNADNVEQLKTSGTKLTELQNICSAHERTVSSLTSSLFAVTLEKNEVTKKYNDLRNLCTRYHNSGQIVITAQSGCIYDLIRQTSILISGAVLRPSSKLLNYVLYLCRKINLNFTRQDIVRAGKYDGDDIIVQFRFPHLKTAFADSEHELDFYPETEEIEFFDVTGNIYYDNLFEYALNLKLFGYKSVFRRADKIFTCRTGNDDDTRLYCKEQIDELINEVK
ncbi:E3 ubiquitin-protein ligase TRAIP [Stomoxys calcitrans]|uniref:RING-type domain-containing protein n=1 Tax=Stomoxys calcitrans TaxID=35570 RepID=A0A1I8Q4C8_STOCA|nr:E3 ubiquitin-protein ligase TRAIP [Stomoxys calcitrans]